MAISAELKKLRAANKGLAIKDVSDASFAKYGRVLSIGKAAKAVAFAKKNAIVGSGIVYEPSVKGLEADAEFMKAAGELV